MPSCLFCAIACGEVPCDQVYADEEFLAFRDIAPQAPTHVLIIPRRHIPGMTELRESDSTLMGRLSLLAARLAGDLKLADAGYRCVINSGEDACQSVPHLHLHLLGGRRLGWPPG
jgi:histidine triad (HIT) family protein